MVVAGIEGILKSLGNGWIIIDIGGIHFRLYIPVSTAGKLGSPGEKVYLHTHLQLKEDSIALYGFSSMEELKLFELLLGVSGIGPRVSLSILSTLTPEQFSLAVSSGNNEVLSSISGIGKKTAARIILELKGKFDQAGGAPIAHPHEDVRAALMGLGYTASEATSAVNTIPISPEMDLESKIRLALKHFSRSA